MLGYHCRLIACHQTAEARQVRLVERLRSADRHADAVQRQRMIAADRFQRAVRRSARAHVVFGMDLEEAGLRTAGEDRVEMFVLEAGPGDAAEWNRKAEGLGCGRDRPDRRVHVAPPLSLLRCAGSEAQTGLSEPFLPFGRSMLVQVPPCTNFHALPWKSVVEVPWQVVPGPAAQSFWPFRATPKHFSFLAATAASPSALVSGAAVASVASAVDMAPARTSVVTASLADIEVSPVRDGIAWQAKSALFGSPRSRSRYRSSRSRVREAVGWAHGLCAWIGLAGDGPVNPMPSLYRDLSRRALAATRGACHR